MKLTTRFAIVGVAVAPTKPKCP